MAIPSFGGPFNYNTKPLELPTPVELFQAQQMPAQAQFQNALRDLNIQKGQAEIQNWLAQAQEHKAKAADRLGQIAYDLDEKSLGTYMSALEAGQDERQARQAAAMAQQKNYDEAVKRGNATGLQPPAGDFDPVVAKGNLFKWDVYQRSKLAQQKTEDSYTNLLSDSTGDRFRMNKSGTLEAFYPPENKFVPFNGKLPPDARTVNMAPAALTGAREAAKQSERVDATEKPLTPVAKLNDDLAAGRITKEQFDQQMAKQGGQQGAREATINQRIIIAGAEAAKDLENVVKLPLTASSGVFGGRKQGPGLFDATKEVLANKITGQEAQTYNIMSTGFQRSLAAIEAAGLMPTGALTHQMESVIFKEGDTNLSKLQKLAQTRQIVEAGLDILASSSRMPEKEQATIKGIISSIQKAVPFTHSDLMALSAAQINKPNTTLKDILKMNDDSASKWKVEEVK